MMVMVFMPVVLILVMTEMSLNNINEDEKALE